MTSEQQDPVAAHPFEFGEWHWQGGLTAKRVDGETVRIRVYDVPADHTKDPAVLREYSLPIAEWASLIVATMSPAHDAKDYYALRDRLQEWSGTA